MRDFIRVEAHAVNASQIVAIKNLDSDRPVLLLSGGQEIPLTSKIDLAHFGLAYLGKPDDKKPARGSHTAVPYT